MRRPPTAPTSPVHHLTLSKEKKNTKWSELLATDVMDGPGCSNTSSNGKDIPKATTHGNPMIKSTLQSS